MNESPTGGESSSTGLSNQPTGQEQVQPNPAESQNQETISHEQSQGTVSTDTANKPTQTNENGGSQNDDESLAKFAKSQGFDPENLSDDVKRALKIAHDNQKAYRNDRNEKKVTEVAGELKPAHEGETEDAKFRREFAEFKYELTTDKFWGQDGRDRSLEPTMVQILNEKKAEFGSEYAFNLSRDLDTLYGMAQLKTGANGTSNEEAIRREERESIRNKANASDGNAHAVNQGTSGTPEKIDRQWLETQYDPSKPEHRKLVDEAVARGDLY